MIHRKMPELTTGNITIPGGWHAWVPEGTNDAQALQLYARYYAADGLRPAQSLEKAEAMLQAVLQNDWSRRLTQFVRREAKLHVSKVGSLAGFDPERLQAAFMPHDNKIGCGGKNALRVLRAEMVAAARNA